MTSLIKRQNYSDRFVRAARRFALAFPDAAQFLQSDELNELQSLQDDKLRRVAEYVLQDGRKMSGAEIGLEIWTGRRQQRVLHVAHARLNLFRTGVDAEHPAVAGHQPAGIMLDISYHAFGVDHCPQRLNRVHKMAALVQWVRPERSSYQSWPSSLRVLPNPTPPSRRSSSSADKRWQTEVGGIEVGGVQVAMTIAPR